jgi:AbrB family looped-hinge helix DNA binding protein
MQHRPTESGSILSSGFYVESVVSTKGQTVIPKEVREALGIKEGTKLFWWVDGERVVIRPLPDDPIAAARGAWADNPVTTAALLAERKRDREKEEAEAKEAMRRWQSTS